MQFWFLPNNSGDFRLKRNGDDNTTCLLTTVDPTDKDRSRLRPFLVEARARGWLALEAGINIDSKGTSELVIHVPLMEAGILLSQQVFPEDEAWTAVRWADGHVDLADEATNALSKRLEGRELSFKDGVGTWAEPVAAVTTPVPKRGCPEPEPCAHRPYQVLAAFSTQTQINTFRRYGYLDARGSRTQARYRIFHRDAAARLGLRSTIINDAGELVCAWQRDVPPEEEVLALKLAVEHREGFLLEGWIQRARTVGLGANSAAWAS